KTAYLDFMRKYAILYIVNMNRIIHIPSVSHSTWGRYGFDRDRSNLGSASRLRLVKRYANNNWQRNKSTCFSSCVSSSNAILPVLARGTDRRVSNEAGYTFTRCLRVTVEINQASCS